MEQLGRYKGRSAVLLTSTQGLELKGSFVRTRMLVNVNHESGNINSGNFSKEAQQSVFHSQEDQDVVLFMGSPKLEGFSELKVNHLTRDAPTIKHLMNPLDDMHKLWLLYWEGRQPASWNGGHVVFYLNLVCQARPRLHNTAGSSIYAVWPPLCGVLKHGQQIK